MRRLATTLLLLALWACAPKPAVSPLDGFAHDYVRLALELGTHDADYVDAYYGPPELKTEAETHPRAVAQLIAEADRIAAGLAAVPADTLQPIEQRRRARLLAYVRSARFRLDVIDGVRAPFQDEAERLFGLRPEIRPLASYDPVLARIDALVPGKGDLAMRVVAFNDHNFTVPPARIEAVANAAIAECRRRTLAHTALPANESFTLELVHGKSWGAYNWFKGDARSVIQINTDLPYRIGAGVIDGCHEGYPGHHVQGINAEKLYRERHWIEYAIAPLFSPQGPLDEGGGDYGIDLVFPGDELLAFERDTLYPLAGLDASKAGAYDALRTAMKELAGAQLTIDEMYLDGKISRVRAIALTQRYQLSSYDRAEHLIAFADQYRSYVINYSVGEAFIRAYADRQGATNDAHWRAYLGILAQPTLPVDLQ